MLGLKNMSDQNKGVLFIAAGLVLLLHTLGILKTGLNYILIGAAVYMLAYGFMKVDGLRYVNQLLGRDEQQ